MSSEVESYSDAVKREREAAKISEGVSTSRRKESSLRFFPQDPYGYNMELLTSSEVRDADTLEKVLSRELALTNIEDDKLVNIYSLRFSLVIIPAFQLWESTRVELQSGELDDGDQDIRLLFDFFLSSTLAELKLSRSKGGWERGQMGGNAAPPNNAPGYKVPQQQNPADASGVKQQYT